MAKTLITARQLQPWTEAEAGAVFADTLYNLELLKTVAGKAELDRLQGVTSSIQTQLNAKLDKASLKNSQAVDWTSDATTATALAIARRVEAEVASAQIGGAMAFKGKWSEKQTPSASTPIKAGYTYAFDQGTPPTGTTVEAGDMLTAAIDITTTAQVADPASWVIVQTNIAGAVSTIEQELTQGRLVVGKGGKTIGTTALTGLLKATAGVPAVATKQDISSLVGTALTIADGNGVSKFSLALGDALRLYTIGKAGSLSFNPTTKAVSINFNQFVETQTGAAVAGQYVSGISIASNGLVTVTRAALPPDVTLIAKNTTSIEGTKDGTNKVFTLPENAVAGSVMLFLNGQCLVQGSDYTISGTGNRTITFAADANIPVASDVLSAYYIKL